MAVMRPFALQRPAPLDILRALWREIVASSQVASSSLQLSSPLEGDVGSADKTDAGLRARRFFISVRLSLRGGEAAERNLRHGCNARMKRDCFASLAMTAVG